MGQHQRFPGGFLIVIAVLVIPSALYGLVNTAEKSDECAVVIKKGMNEEHAKRTGLKCE